MLTPRGAVLYCVSYRVTSNEYAEDEDFIGGWGPQGMAALACMAMCSLILLSINKAEHRLVSPTEEAAFLYAAHSFATQYVPLQSMRPCSRLRMLVCMHVYLKMKGTNAMRGETFTG
jgi:hypothetical protein